MILPLFVLAAIVNIAGKLNNYNIKNHTLNIRVRRNTGDESIYTDSSEEGTLNVINNSPLLKTLISKDKKENNRNSRLVQNFTTKRLDTLLHKFTKYNCSDKYDKDGEEIISSDINFSENISERLFANDFENVEIIKAPTKEEKITEAIDTTDRDKENNEVETKASGVTDDWKLGNLIYKYGKDNKIILLLKELSKMSVNASLERIKRNASYNGMFYNNYTDRQGYSYTNFNQSSYTRNNNGPIRANKTSYTNYNGYRYAYSYQTTTQKIFPNMYSPYTRNSNGPNRVTRVNTTSINRLPYYTTYNGTVTNYNSNQYRQTERTYMNSYFNIKQPIYNGGAVPTTNSNYPYNARSTNFTNYNPNNYQPNAFNNNVGYQTNNAQFTINPGNNIYRAATNQNIPNDNNFYNNYNSINNLSNNPQNNMAPKYVTSIYAPSYTTGYATETSTTIPATTPEIVMSCFICKSVGCPAFFKRIGFLCVPE